MKKLIILIALLAQGCGGGGSGGRSSSKNFFSVWTAVDNSLQFDFRGGEFNTIYSGYEFTYSTGETCSCSIMAVGDQSQGDIYVSSCSYIGGGSGNPGCNALEQGGSPYYYEKSGNTLTMCYSYAVGCLDYK